MYCPQCGQQQISGEVRFCSRCGFPLAGVAQLLASGGALPVAGRNETQSKPSPRQRGIRQGVLLWMIGAFLVPFFAVAIPTGGPKGNIVAATAIIFFIGGLLRLLYALLFQENFACSESPQNSLAPAYAPPPATILNAPNAREAAQLPPRPSAIGLGARRVNTGELVPPPVSVTDHTTQLLGERHTEKS